MFRIIWIRNTHKNDNFALINVNLNIYRYINKLKPIECLFALMPYQHSENIIEQQKGNFKQIFVQLLR